MEVEIKMGFKYQRLLGYFLGFILFYAPFALFQKIIFFAFTGKWQQLTIHSLCFRIQTEHLLDGKLLLMSLPFIACIVILLKYSVKAPAGHNLPQNTGPKNKVTISKITIQAIKGSDISSNFPSSKCSV